MSAVPDLILNVPGMCFMHKILYSLDPWIELLIVIDKEGMFRIKSRIQNCYSYWLECPVPIFDRSRRWSYSSVQWVNMMINRRQKTVQPSFRQSSTGRCLVKSSLVRSREWLTLVHKLFDGLHQKGIGF